MAQHLPEPAPPPPDDDGPAFPPVSSASLPGYGTAPAETPLSRLVSADVNFDHMQMLVRFSVADYYPDIDDDMMDLARDLHQNSLREPYYLLEILALSARRLALVEPSKSETYLAYAVSLQTKAISLYNAAVSQLAALDRTTCVPVLMFASLLGRHLIVDLLARREPDLDRFMPYYVEFCKIGSGIGAVAHAAWPLLLDSDIKTFLLWAASIHTQTPTGRECDALRDLLLGAPDLDPPTRAACEPVLRLLQVGFDLMRARPAQNRRYMQIFAWSVAAPPAFTELLERRRPEALVALAYFGVLLHWARDRWEVGTAGEYIIKAVSAHLGPGWDYHLAYPLAVLQGDRMEE